jgi:hypothetical protein
MSLSLFVFHFCIRGVLSLMMITENRVLTLSWVLHFCTRNYEKTGFVSDYCQSKMSQTIFLTNSVDLWGKHSWRNFKLNLFVYLIASKFEVTWKFGVIMDRLDESPCKSILSVFDKVIIIVGKTKKTVQILILRVDGFKIIWQHTQTNKQTINRWAWNVKKSKKNEEIEMNVLMVMMIKIKRLGWEKEKGDDS